MTCRALMGEHTLLRIFIGESDVVAHKSLYLEILERAKAAHLAGCTVLRGIAGFGASSIVHKDHPLRLSGDLPIVIEIIDTREHITKFLAEVKPLLAGGLVTQEEVHVHHYSHR